MCATTEPCWLCWRAILHVFSLVVPAPSCLSHRYRRDKRKKRQSSVLRGTSRAEGDDDRHETTTTNPLRLAARKARVAAAAAETAHDIRSRAFMFLCAWAMLDPVELYVVLFVANSNTSSGTHTRGRIAVATFALLLALFKTGYLHAKVNRKARDAFNKEVALRAAADATGSAADDDDDDDDAHAEKVAAAAVRNAQDSTMLVLHHDERHAQPPPDEDELAEDADEAPPPVERRHATRDAAAPATAAAAHRPAPRVRAPAAWGTAMAHAVLLRTVGAVDLVLAMAMHSFIDCLLEVGTLS